MGGPSEKRQKREDYRQQLRNDSDKTIPKLPKKKFYRQRAHANPFSDHALTYPRHPSEIDWSALFPAIQTSIRDDSAKDNFGPQELDAGSHRIVSRREVEIADIGCGFGGLLFSLAPTMPETLILGMEIRVSVTEFVQEKIQALRTQQTLLSSDPSPTVQNASQSDRKQEQTSASYDKQHDYSVDAAAPEQSAKVVAGGYNNIACIRANAMKFLPNFFRKHQLTHIFICFPDPHFKARKHKARIVSTTLNSEYAYVLRPGGKVYTITDVEQLHLWMVEKFSTHQSFTRISEDDLKTDWCVEVMSKETEEGKKVERNHGKKFIAVFRRLEDPPWP